MRASVHAEDYQAYLCVLPADVLADAYDRYGSRLLEGNVRGHIVFRKTYSSKRRFFSYQHEQAYLLAKGRPPLPKQPLADVMDMPFSGKNLHPKQNQVEALAPLVRSFTLPRELVLDPFAGSGSSCAAALLTGRRYVGIELDAEYFHHASARLERVKERIAARKRSSQVLIPTMR
ncbi:MAG: DNA methyltransferase [Acidobacteriaceae bacterium]